MVDFQSRDTRRGPVADDDDESENEDEDEDETPAADDAAAADDSGVEDENEQSTPASDEREQAESARSDADPLAGPDPTPADGDTGAGTVESESTPADGDTGAGTVESESTPGTAGPPSEGEPARGTDATGADHQSVEPARSVDVAVVAVGDAGEGAVVEAFESAGHSIVTRERLNGDYDGLQRSVDTLVSRDDVDVVVTTGGIGIDPGEVTIEAVHPLFEKALPGFGEAFRTLLYDVIGTGIVAVRSAAGVADGTLVFCLPADPEAAGLAVEEILATEAPELVAHLDS